MPAYLKIFLSILAEVFCIVAGGAAGAWFPMRDVPAGEGNAGDGMGMLLFGGLGIIVAGTLGIVGLAVFWSVQTARTEAAKSVSILTGQDLEPKSTWPPPPKR